MHFLQVWIHSEDWLTSKQLSDIEQLWAAEVTTGTSCSFGCCTFLLPVLKFFIHCNKKESHLNIKIVVKLSPRTNETKQKTGNVKHRLNKAAEWFLVCLVFEFLPVQLLKSYPTWFCASVPLWIPAEHQLHHLFTVIITTRTTAERMYCIWCCNSERKKGRKI